MEATSDHLDHQVLLGNNCERICVGYKPDGVLGNQLNHQLHSEHGNDICTKIADIKSLCPSGKPSVNMNMCFSEKILPVFDVSGEAFNNVVWRSRDIDLSVSLRPPSRLCVRFEDAKLSSVVDYGEVRHVQTIFGTVSAASGVLGRSGYI